MRELLFIMLRKCPLGPCTVPGQTTAYLDAVLRVKGKAHRTVHVAPVGQDHKGPDAAELRAQLGDRPGEADVQQQDAVLRCGAHRREQCSRLIQSLVEPSRR